MSEAITPEGHAQALTQIVRTTCVADTWRVFCETLEEYGVDVLIYGISNLASYDTFRHLGDTLVLLKAPDDYAEPYLAQRLYRNSLTFEWASRNEGFVSWKEAYKQFPVHPSPNRIEIRSLNAEYHMLSGQIGTLHHVIPGTKGVIGIGNTAGWETERFAAFWDEHGAQLRALSETMHLRIASLPHIGVFPHLTLRQLEVLSWYAQGKLVQDISTIMGISTGTVEKHLRLAREALDADTTAHAVRKATSLNLLTG